MSKYLTSKILIFIIIIVIIVSYFFLSSLIGNSKSSKLQSFLNDEQIELIQKYIFPQMLISQQEERIKTQS